ncbi:MAG: glycoside hydrolase family 2, partial [Lachnospiraceae bacterium]|nr:glycoside hydrolase family 2 [Lachnospiraceae bacterium]
MRYLFNKGWKFLELNTESGLDDAMAHMDCFTPVRIPHDWLIYDSADLYRDGTGWYMRELDIEEKKGRYFLEFDAVYMDSHVYVNGICVCEWKYGYSAFDCEITDELHEGKNLIFVSACHRSPNSRWYSGAGIYRNVYIRQTQDTYIAKDGVYVSNNI